MVRARFALERKCSISCLFEAVVALGGAGRMKPIVLAVGGVGEGIVVATLAALILGGPATSRLSVVLAIRDPFVNLVVDHMRSVDELLPLLDFLGVVGLLLSRLHLGSFFFGRNWVSMV